MKRVISTKDARLLVIFVNNIILKNIYYLNFFQFRKAKDREKPKVPKIDKNAIEVKEL